MVGEEKASFLHSGIACIAYKHPELQTNLQRKIFFMTMIQLCISMPMCIQVIQRLYGIWNTTSTRGKLIANVIIHITIQESHKTGLSWYNIMGWIHGTTFSRHPHVHTYIWTFQMCHIYLELIFRTRYLLYRKFPRLSYAPVIFKSCKLQPEDLPLPVPPFRILDWCPSGGLRLFSHVNRKSQHKIVFRNIWVKTNTEHFNHALWQCTKLYNSDLQW